MSDIIGFEACSRELRRLLDEIASAILAAGDAGPDALHAAVMKETRKLVDFTNRTEPADLLDAQEVDAIRKIDQAADEARQQIFGDSAGTIVSRMQDRISQLNQLEKAVRQETAVNAQEADRLRLIPVRDAIDAMTATVKAVRNSREALSADDPDEAVVRSRIDAVLRAVASLEKTTATLFKAS
jgi:hypothetical protein